MSSTLLGNSQASATWCYVPAIVFSCTLLSASTFGCSDNGSSGTQQTAATGNAAKPPSTPSVPGGSDRMPEAGTELPSRGQAATATGRLQGGNGGGPASSTTGNVSLGGSDAGRASASGATAVSAAGRTGAGSGGINSVTKDAGMASADDDAGMMCVPPEKLLDVSTVLKCPMELCPAQDSVCLPKGAVSQLVPQSTIDLLSKCNPDNVCVPIELATTAGKGIQPTCRSINGAEGRCISTCVPIVANQASILPKDTCTGSDLCAPCFDPRTGEDTLACRQGCDKGPTEPAKPFAKCCSGRGLCVPPALAGSQAKNLNKESCGESLLCAPKELTDLTYKPKSCSSLEGAEGRCISTCVGGAVAKQKERLPTAGCDSNEVCAPCYDPITGESTGACEVNGDKPAKPKLVFPTCCGTTGGQPVGVCVPPSLAGDQASILRQESCPSGRLCAPIKKAQDPAYKFPTCFGLGTGACVNKCIPDQGQAAILSRTSCATDEVCAPCSLLGQESGVCK